MFGFGATKSNDWIELTSSKEHFRVLFPDQSSREFHSIIGTDDGVSPATIVYQAKDSNHRATYQVSVTRLMEYFGTPYDLLISALDQVLKDIKGGNIQDSKITKFQDHPAIQFTIGLNNQNRIRGLALLVNKSMFMLTQTSNQENMEDYNKFLGSFELLT